MVIFFLLISDLSNNSPYSYLEVFYVCLFSVYFCVCTCLKCTQRSKGNLQESILSFNHVDRFQRLNLCSQVWWQGPLPAEQFHWPLKHLLLFCLRQSQNSLAGLNSLCKPGWLQTHGDPICLCLPNTGIKGMSQSCLPSFSCYIIVLFVLFIYLPGLTIRLLRFQLFCFYFWYGETGYHVAPSAL